jgi:hypothetical protein
MIILLLLFNFLLGTLIFYFCKLNFHIAELLYNALSSVNGSENRQLVLWGVSVYVFEVIGIPVSKIARSCCSFINTKEFLVPTIICE